MPDALLQMWIIIVLCISEDTQGNNNLKTLIAAQMAVGYKILILEGV